MKLLLMAYECSPYRGSECAVGWGRLLGAAEIAETHIVTSEANFRALQRAHTEGLLPNNVRFYTPKPDAKLRAFEQKPVLFAYNYRAYHHWQRLAGELIRTLHAQEQFDLVHQVNVCTFREPGYGYMLGVPFVWGPVGGTQNFPMRFLTTLPPVEAIKEGLRNVANHMALRKHRVRRAARHASVLLAANSTNERDFARVFRREPALLLETGLHSVPKADTTRFLRRVRNRELGLEAAPLRLLWSGELQTRKALPVLLRALALLPAETHWTLDVLGDGPMHARWTAMAHALGLSDRVQFLGRLPFEEAKARMHFAELFCFSSLRDTSGNVVLEALAAGVPVLCFDHQGGRDMVNEHCGVKLPVRSPQQAYREWAEAIEALAADPERLLQLSRGATARAEQFLWSRNHDRMNNLYRRYATGGSKAAAAGQPCTVSGEAKGQLAAQAGVQ